MFPLIPQKETRIKKRFKLLQKEDDKYAEKYNVIQKNEFSFHRDVLVFSGTIFGSSIALSNNKNINDLFISLLILE